MRRFLPFAALLGVALVLGCQDVGTGPDGLVPQFDKKDLDRGPCPGDVAPVNGHCHGDEEPPPPTADSRDLFLSPAFTCDGGAFTTDEKFGQVNWASGRIFVGEAALPASDHIHFDLQLTGVITAGDYTIFGSQNPDPDCDDGRTTEIPGGAVDLGTVKVKKNGKVVTPGILQFEFPLHDAQDGDLETEVWVTVSGPGGLFRSTPFPLVILKHVEVQ